MNEKVLLRLLDISTKRSFSKKLLSRWLFKKAVQQIVVEISSACNRRCVYCPQALVRRPKMTMSQEILDTIVASLSCINYTQQICLNWFNEPLLDGEHLTSVIKRFKHALPRSRIMFSTNGDLLRETTLGTLRSAGLDALYVTQHPSDAEAWDAVCISKGISEKCKALGLPKSPLTVNPGTSVYCDTEFCGMPVQIFSLNFLSVGVDRASALTTIKNSETSSRIAPCYRPLRDFCIAYDGTVYPCCQFYHGLSQHKKYIVGNVLEQSLFEIYTSSLFCRFRSVAGIEGIKPNPCKTCING